MEEEFREEIIERRNLLANVDLVLQRRKDVAELDQVAMDIIQPLQVPSLSVVSCGVGLSEPLEPRFESWTY
jgi:hypothetical protein